MLLLTRLLSGSVAVAITVRASKSVAASVVASVAALLVGFAYAGLRAQARLADSLAAADEGREVRVTGVVASLPVRLDRGVRFEFDVESHGPEAKVPARVLLDW